MSELLQMTLPELLVPEFRPLFFDYVARIRREGLAAGCMALLTRSGEQRIWEYHNRLHTEADGSTIILGIAHDITERVQAEHALRASEMKFRSIFQDAPVGMFMATTEGRLLEVNEAFCQFLGFTQEELLGSRDVDFTHPDDCERSTLAMDQALRQKHKIDRFEKRYLHKSDETRWGEVSISLVQDYGGDSRYFIAQIVDIAQRKQAEERQKTSLQQATLLRELSHLVSRGVSVEEVAHAAAQGLTEHLNCDLAFVFAAEEETLRLQALSHREWQHQLESSAPRLLAQCLCGLAASHCQPIYCNDVFTDPRCISDECKQAGIHSFAALPLKNESRVIGVLGIGSGIVRDFQKQASFLETLAGEISAGLANSLLRQRLTERAAVLEREIIERKRVQDTLQDREERLRMMVEQMPGILWTVDRDLRFTSSSGKALKQIGLVEDQVCGMTVAEFVHNDDPQFIVNSSHRRALQGECVSYESEFSGRTYEVLVAPLRDAQGDIVSALGMALDITELRQKTQRLQTLLEISLSSAAHLELRALFSAVSGCLRGVLNQDFAGLFVWDGAVMRPVSLDLPAMGLESEALIEISENHCWNPANDKIEVLEAADLRNDNFLAALLEAGIRSLCGIPLATGDGLQGTLLLGSNRDQAFGTSELDLLTQVAPQVALALANARAYEQIKLLKDKLAEEKVYLEEEIQTESRFDEIVGSSPTLKAVLEQVSIVAPTDATVLITGETGTGKELIARAIHRMSSRSAGSFIKLNCAAIPAGLLESELFGYERGAFTSASTRKIGRLELADQGTLFLDEVGELPLELQPKLLRVLEDREFERLGSTKTTRVNTRLIAATNRDLVKDVAQAEFRSDLFFRLNVFPVRVPPLRERRSDIPSLITHFVQKYAARMKKRIDRIPKETMNRLTGWDWAGNVRELENFIERSVILTSGSVLEAPLSELPLPSNGAPGGLQTNVEAIQRDQIVRALREAGGVIAGPSGAAARLGIKRTTLQSMVQRFAIPIEKYRPNREP